MGIELTTFEQLTMDEMDPVKLRFRAEQAAQAAEVHVDFTTEGFIYPQRLGELSLRSLVDIESVEELEPAA